VSANLQSQKHHQETAEKVFDHPHLRIKYGAGSSPLSRFTPFIRDQ